MRFFNLFRTKVVSWMAREFEAECKRRTENQICTLGPGSHLANESEINNFYGDPGKITVGKNSHIRGRLLIYGHEGKICIGDWCYVGVRSEIWSMASITIGDRVLIAHNVNIHDGTAHSANPVERHHHFRHIIEKGHPRLAAELPGVYSAPVVIEDDVWISFGVTILRGVRIGRGCVIAAGSVVTCDVPPGMIYRNRVTPVVEPINIGLR